MDNVQQKKCKEWKKVGSQSKKSRIESTALAEMKQHDSV